MPKIVLYPHGGSGNHGCEALVRSIAGLFPRHKVVLCSKAPEQDEIYLPSNIKIIPEYESYNRLSLGYLKAFLKYKLGDKDAYEGLAYRHLIDEATDCDFAMSIGGDNYCYSTPSYIYIINRLLRRRKISTVLFGCSIEEKLLTDEMKDDLLGYNLIVARESLTYELLKKIGAKNVLLLPDPAFTLSPEESELPEDFVAGNEVGINVSPMVMDYSGNSTMVIENYRKLIGYILSSTDMGVTLIPHVVWPDNDDRHPLTLLFDEFKESNRVKLLTDRNASALKGVISKCRFLVTARTHASIAAYSSGVPTLVVGYSIKAEGIARDIFDNIEDHVVRVQEMKDSDILLKKFKALVLNEANEKGKLKSYMGHIAKAFSELPSQFSRLS